VQKITGENLKVVWAEFSTLSPAVLLLDTHCVVRAHARCLSWKLGLGFDLLTLRLAVSPAKVRRRRGGGGAA
jgi:hypothetical protein